MVHEFFIFYFIWKIFSVFFSLQNSVIKIIKYKLRIFFLHNSNWMKLSLWEYSWKYQHFTNLQVVKFVLNIKCFLVESGNWKIGCTHGSGKMKNLLENFGLESFVANFSRFHSFFLEIWLKILNFSRNFNAFIRIYRNFQKYIQNLIDFENIQKIISEWSNFRKSCQIFLLILWIPNGIIFKWSNYWNSSQKILELLWTSKKPLLNSCQMLHYENNLQFQTIKITE